MRNDDLMYLAREAGRLLADETYRQPDSDLDEVHPLVAAACQLLFKTIDDGGCSKSEVVTALRAMTRSFHTHSESLEGPTT